MAIKLEKVGPPFQVSMACPSLPSLSTDEKK